MMPLVAILVVFGSFMAFDLDQSRSWSIIFIIIGSVVFLVGIAGFFLVDDHATRPTETGYWENVSYGFRKATVRENRELYLSDSLL